MGLESQQALCLGWRASRGRGRGCEPPVRRVQEKPAGRGPGRWWWRMGRYERCLEGAWLGPGQGLGL